MQAAQDRVSAFQCLPAIPAPLLTPHSQYPCSAGRAVGRTHHSRGDAFGKADLLLPGERVLQDGGMPIRGFWALSHLWSGPRGST